MHKMSIVRIRLDDKYLTIRKDGLLVLSNKDSSMTWIKKDKTLIAPVSFQILVPKERVILNLKELVMAEDDNNTCIVSSLSEDFALDKFSSGNEVAFYSKDDVKTKWMIELV